MKSLWTKCQIINTVDVNEIYVSKKIKTSLGKNVEFRFGQKKQYVTVNSFNNNQESRRLGMKYQNPISVYLSKSLVDKLSIQTDNVYRLNIKQGVVELGPVIGLLLGEQQYYYHDEFMSEYKDAMKRYEEVGGLVLAFKTCSIDWDNKSIYGLYYNHKDNQWSYGKFPFPSVIYRRAFKATQNITDKLYKMTNGKIFNANRYSKWDMYNILKENRKLKKYLPETEALVSMESFKKFINEHNDVILKPVGLSRGRGICIIKKLGEELMEIHDYGDGRNSTQATFTKEDIISYVKESGFINKDYIMQPFLNFARINGLPWDIRIVMQKGADFRWKCNGIECRIAGVSNLITNISRGGRAVSISKALKLSFGPKIKSSKVKKEIIKICKGIAENMDSEREIFAELGIDIAIDQEQNFWIIESNVRPTFNGFRKHMEYENYVYLCTAPIDFASSLAGFKRSDKSETKI
ncbi:YheC/YheD family protein [Mycoplasmatota bacterium WC44]